jgi:hypothetical protein
MVLRRIFRPQRDEVTGEWRKLHNEELNDLYSSSHENQSSGSRVVPCGRTDGRTDMMKLIVTLRNFANSPKKETFTLLPSMKTEGEVTV